MNIYLRALARELDGPSAYAWIIDRDHTEVTSGDAGVTGPSDAPAELLERLAAGEGYTFTMRDDDGELYYTGRGIATDDELGSEAFAYGPLGDFGMPNAGAVEITWAGHPEWDCG